MYLQKTKQSTLSEKKHLKDATMKGTMQTASNKKWHPSDFQMVTGIQRKKNTTGLPDTIKNGVESLSGYSLDNVKVHYNSDKPTKMQALAYTQNTDIHVAPGQETHLPHEAWHVVQQMQGRVKPTTEVNGMGVNDNVSLEHEADVMGTKAIQGKFKTQDGLQIGKLAVNVAQRALARKDNENENIKTDPIIIERGAGVKWAKAKNASFGHGVRQCLDLALTKGSVYGYKIGEYNANENPHMWLYGTITDNNTYNWKGYVVKHSHDQMHVGHLTNGKYNFHTDNCEADIEKYKSTTSRSYTTFNLEQNQMPIQTHYHGESLDSVVVASSKVDLTYEAERYNNNHHGSTGHHIFDVNDIQ